VSGFAVALGIGLGLGIERERHKGQGAGREAAGVRTFALVALLGVASVRVGGTALLAVALAFVGAAAVASYVYSDHSDPGLTTEMALVLDLLLGGLAESEPALAAATGTAAALLLASRTRLHRFARETLSEQEIRDGLLLAACALIVLPLVPDEGIGPYGAFNPFTLWRLVVLVMVVNAAGYVALRALGPRVGLPLAGFVGGFVSSTATIGTMGARAAREPRLLRGSVAAGVASTLATVVFLAMVVGAASPAALREIALPLVLAGAAATAYALLFAWRAAAGDSGSAERGRAFDLRTALILAVSVSALLVISAALEATLGRSGALLAIAVAGFADAQTAGFAAASLVAEGRLSAADAAVPILTGLTTNTLSKATIAAVLGHRRYALAIWPGLAVVLAAAWAGWSLGRLL
jgi:uncharacterized membrane protein (DUF4010 family)